MHQTLGPPKMWSSGFADVLYVATVVVRASDLRPQVSRSKKSPLEFSWPRHVQFNNLLLLE